MSGADENVVTWEAADRGARCAMGCSIIVLLLVGVALVIAGALRGPSWWMVGVGGLCVLAGIGLLLFIRSPRRGRWEISFDGDRRVVRLVASEGRQVTEREFGFGEIRAIELEQITRDVSTGDNVPFLLPVFRLKNGETVRLHERMSIKRPERADEVIAQMRELVGLK